MEGDAWRQWNAADARRRARHAGARGQGARAVGTRTVDAGIGVSGGGRLFVTCLHTYMLEVYYRHLPLYQLERAGGGRQRAERFKGAAVRIGRAKLLLAAPSTGVARRSLDLPRPIALLFVGVAQLHGDDVVAAAQEGVEHRRGRSACRARAP